MFYSLISYPWSSYFAFHFKKKTEVYVSWAILPKLPPRLPPLSVSLPGHWMLMSGWKLRHLLQWNSRLPLWLQSGSHNRGRSPQAMTHALLMPRKVRIQEERLISWSLPLAAMVPAFACPSHLQGTVEASWAGQGPPWRIALTRSHVFLWPTSSAPRLELYASLFLWVWSPELAL